MHLILTGATGLVGSAVLDAMIKLPDVSRISVLSRRPVKMAEAANDPRVNVIIHKDFTTYDSSLLEKLSGADGCVWALGISQAQVGKDEYVEITKTYALAAAEAFRTLPASETKPFNFVYVSGEGSTFKPSMFTPLFGRIKGETELALAEMRKQHPAFHASTVRAGFIDKAAQPDIQPFVPVLGYSRVAMEAVLGPVVRNVWKGAWSPTEHLGKFLAEMAMGQYDAASNVAKGYRKLDGGFTVVDNVGFRRLVGLD
ncbi:hypothetical protein B0H63DRAFT_464522, partial [Podospora didyma]